MQDMQPRAERAVMVSRVIPVDPFDLVIFGGTGDLARRKILPGLYRRFVAGQMPEAARIIGAARSDMDDAGFRGLVAEALAEFLPKGARDEAQEAAFLERLSYVKVDAMGQDGWKALAKYHALRCCAGLLLLGRPVALWRPGRTVAQVQGRPARRSDRCGKAFRARPDLGPRAQRHAGRAFRRKPDLPHRPLSRQRDGSEPYGRALRQCAF